MRMLQMIIFFLATALLIASVFFIGKQTGEDLWKAGIAILLLDVVCIQLWPLAKRS